MTPEAYAETVRNLIEAAARVCRKYGTDFDWTEWSDLRDALKAIDPAVRVFEEKGNEEGGRAGR